MEYRKLGATGLVVSSISMGTVSFGGARPVSGVSAQDARNMVDLAIEHGVNLFDTADVYTGGEAEEILGTVLSQRRDHVLIASKVGQPRSADPNDRGLSRRNIISACEGSLRRLKTDHIDLYQMHGWDASADMDETLEAMNDLVRTGKIRAIGLSNFTGWQLADTFHRASSAGLAAIASHQIYYSLLHREAEFELFPASRQAVMANLVWGPLAGGLLSGKYRRDQQWPDGSRMTSDWKEPPIDDWDHAFGVIEAAQAVAESRALTTSQVSLAWTLANPAVTSVIVGARNHEQLLSNIRANEVQLSHEEVAALDAASERPAPYPVWHQRRYVADRGSPARISVR